MATPAAPGFATNADIAQIQAQSDAWLDSFDAGNTPALPDDWDDHPFWADKEKLADPSSKASKLVQEMQDECTPEERAEGCKETGNELLKQGQRVRKKRLIRDASEQYSQGLSILSDADPDVTVGSALRCALFSNRSLAHTLLGNWRKSLEDSCWAIKCDGKHIKSHIRAATAATELRMWEEALRHCKSGLQIEPTAAELLRIQKLAAKNLLEEKEKAAREAAAYEALQAPFRATAAAICARGMKMTQPQTFGYNTAGAKARYPWLDEQNVLHLPITLCYPEAHPYHDVIEDFAEDQCFDDHLDQVFSDEAGPLPWDDKKEYQRSRVDLYYCSNAGGVLKEAQIADVLQGKFPTGFVEQDPQIYGSKASNMQLIDQSDTLQTVLKKHDHVIPCNPVFWVISRGSKYEQQFLRSFHKLVT